MHVARGVPVLALLTALACTSAPSGTPTTPPDGSPASNPPASSTPPVAAPTTPLASVPPSPIVTAAPLQTPGPAWQTVLDGIDDQGQVSRETSLQAFALAFGGLPGVTPPPGEAGFMPSGSMALRWLVSYWWELTPGQREAAAQAVPDLAPLLGSGRHVVLAVQNRTDAYYTSLAREMFGEIGARLTTPLSVGLTITARVGLIADATAGAAAGVFDANGGMSGAPALCKITVSAMGDGLGERDTRAMMAHEAWHCYEGAIIGLARYWSHNPAPWIIEGEAEWVAATLVPDAKTMAGAWQPYLTDPGFSLLKRAYSAIGFYAQLESTGTDMWGTLVPILLAADNQAAYITAGGTGDALLDTWAASYLRDRSRGPQWEVRGPAVIPDRAVPTGLHLGNGGSITAQVGPYANEISVFGETPDVLVVTTEGHARLSDAAQHDYVALGGGTFCLISTGCVCPGASGQPPPLPLDGNGVAFALTGGPDGAGATLSGVAFDDYCQPLTGLWTGSWRNDNGRASGTFTMQLVQRGGAFSGTVSVDGQTCVRDGTVNGTVNRNDAEFGWVFAERTVSFAGTVRGTSMSGTWNGIACGPPYGPPGGPYLVSGTFEATKQT